MPGRVMPPSGRGMDNKGPKQKLSQEVEQTSAYCDNSPAKKKKAQSSKTPASYSSDLFEAELAGANREVNMLFSKYSEVLSAFVSYSERAAIDASQVRELEDILMEARNLESHLKEKKEHLRRTLALISDKLQG
uniref:Testis-expressed sequence 12 protein n=1 Tax=Oncorhynchus tshawytscha TaxID=74940 RepID=A0A8C8LNX9_ONCTS